MRKLSTVAHKVHFIDEFGTLCGVKRVVTGIPKEWLSEKARMAPDVCRRCIRAKYTLNPEHAPNKDNSKWLRKLDESGLVTFAIG